MRKGMPKQISQMKLQYVEKEGQEKLKQQKQDGLTDEIFVV